MKISDLTPENSPLDCYSTCKMMLALQDAHVFRDMLQGDTLEFHEYRYKTLEAIFVGEFMHDHLTAKQIQILNVNIDNALNFLEK